MTHLPHLSVLSHERNHVNKKYPFKDTRFHINF